ncbi:protein rapunzel-like [Conger conger]|uniref:protein rapunzel-like n=1 Tax=Conger conger TaxID=82655 RepID=UPI002A5A5A3C|nr:protein rapunzel-like [Conger conger]
MSAVEATVASRLMKRLADKKESVEAFMETLEKGAELLVETVGEMLPVFSVVGPVVQLALDNVESKEAEFMTEQFQKVRERLGVVSEEIRRVDQEIRKSGADVAYFSAEENLSNQFRKFMDILNAKSKFREVKKKLFLEHFSKTGGDKNLHTLYNAVTGDKFSGESVLEITLNYHEKSRRVTEDFCARLKNLFCIGLIALVGQAALKGAGEEEDVLKDWGERMRVVEEKMKAAVEACKASFAEQAELDVGKRLKEWSDRPPVELAGDIAEFLNQKYDWVSWSVRAYARSRGCFSDLVYGSKDQAICGGSHFTYEGGTVVVVSYSQGRIRDLEKMARRIRVCQPQGLVHVVSSRWAVAVDSSSFPDDCQYYQRYRNAHIYIHAE